MSVRDRIEARQLAEKYAAREPRQTAGQVEAERLERLSQNAKKIRETQVQTLLLDMSDAEREVVYGIVGRERPECLGSFDVLQATLLSVREVGTANLREAMNGTTRDEQNKVWEILKHATAEQRLGMDSGVACREALRQVRSTEYLEEQQ